MENDSRSMHDQAKLPLPNRFRSASGLLWIAVAMCGLTGCASSAYRYGHAETYHTSAELAAIQGDQFERGQPRPVLDGVGWVIGIPSKIILWDRRVDNHAVSPETEQALVKYLEDNELQNVKVRVNQYAPREEWQRLVANKSVGAGWRYTLGTLSWVGYTIFPGRVFGGDNYNPFTNTINVYSDAPAIVLHEGGHAKDFSQRTLPGTYAAIYALVPFAPLYHEAVATSDVLTYLRTEGTEEEEQEAYRLLYPAYGTYIGNAVGGPLIPIVGGHVVGRIKGARVPKEREADQERVAAIREKHQRTLVGKQKPTLPREIPSKRGSTGSAESLDDQTDLADVTKSRGPRTARRIENTENEDSPIGEESSFDVRPAGHKSQFTD